MKRVFKCVVLVCAYALGLISCVTKDVEHIPADIAFRPVIGTDTRSDDAIPFKANQTFKVWGINEKGNEYLSGETITCNGGHWRSKMLWPDTGELSFTAVSPDNLTTEYSYTDGICIRNVVAPSDGTDILVCYPTKEYNKVDSLVSLNFEHALAQVDFRIKHSLSSGTSVKVSKISLKNIAREGNFNVNGSYTWQYGDLDYNLVVFDAEKDGGELDITNEIQYVGDLYFVIPQDCDKAVMEVEFKFTIDGVHWIPEQVMTSYVLGTNWQPNSLYTYTLNLTEAKLLCTTGISNWSNR